MPLVRVERTLAPKCLAKRERCEMWRWGQRPLYFRLQVATILRPNSFPANHRKVHLTKMEDPLKTKV